MPKATETLLEINLNALDNNYKYLTSKIKPGTKVLAVVKAFAYGSDSVVIAKELVELGVDYFAVAYANEGETLRNAKIETPILVLHTLPVNFEVIVNRCLEPSIYSRKTLEEFIAFSEEKKQINYPIHLKFNTGLNRLGFVENDIPFIAEMLSKTKSVKVKSAFSHLAASEDLKLKEFTLGQIEMFQKISEELIAKIGYKPFLHCANTSGIINYPEAHFDMVRTGIGLYGFGNDKEENKHLKPVGTLKTVISQIHKVENGESVGYNRGFIAEKATRSATLPIGHADGIPRSYGKGKGWVTINGKKAHILGNVCMDMIMVDVTDIDCEEGDEVIVFGPSTTAEELSAAINSISYELITAVSQRVKRVICRN
ncbi:alanine racemase [Aequorivita lipolytica]|uniref:Alanine racemase n=1 Tax=Aequorivita lipolytica TaxID=153267 RepID=A0A5C6YRK5_9FLAO|nr:alanine racemase [Aequorivita lipolytica]TXD70148.1 alanine racemase [Aequorivita lipolytica]SRX50564.1 Alanine racemase 1 [Aequorivita lipolytica]